MNEELYIGVGCIEAQLLPFRVLQFSIMRHPEAIRAYRVEERRVPLP